MRWVAGHRQRGRARTHAHPRWLLRMLVIVAAAAICIVVAGCGSPSVPQLPAGSYSSAAYDFHVAYPRNWKANPCDATTCASGPAAAIPFNLVITRTGDAHSSASLISTCTITVMNLKNSDIAAGAKNLAADKTLQATTIAGVPGYKSTPLTQVIPNSTISVTHTDYYVVHGDYEYQLSTDSVKGDNADADLQSIIASFGFGA